MSAWLVNAYGDEREHAGNDGYRDDPSSAYEWDSTVANHSRLRVGDVIAVRDQSRLLGVSVIDEIVTETATKPIYRCPACGRTNIKRRLRSGRTYRCARPDCHEEFDEPQVEWKDVTRYRSNHANSWQETNPPLEARTVKRMALAPESQHSLNRLDAAQLEDVIGELPRFVTRSGKQAGHSRSWTRVRVGQAEFRASLLKEFGAVCALTGPCPASALEAAHLYSYADAGSHYDSGGLLLRRDVHRLFDTGQIAVDPLSGLIDVANDIQVFPIYNSLHRAPLRVPVTERHREWLDKHWTEHRKL